MDAKDSTFDLFENEHKAFGEACDAFTKKENVEQIAKQIGMNPTVLRSKLNSNTKTHHLSAMELVKVTRASGNYRIVNSLLFGLNMVGAPISTDGEQQNFTQRALENSMHAGEISRLVMENGGEIRLPRTKRQEFINRAHSSVRNLVLLISDLENRSATLQPLVSAGVDFVTSGMPLPGIA